LGIPLFSPGMQLHNINNNSWTRKLSHMYDEKYNLIPYCVVAFLPMHTYEYYCVEGWEPAYIRLKINNIGKDHTTWNLRKYVSFSWSIHVTVLTSSSTGAACGAGTTYPSGALEFTPGF
jgi:hypothetical protein